MAERLQEKTQERELPGREDQKNGKELVDLKMKLMFIVAFCIIAFYLATDTVVGLAREFEHGIEDSKIEKPLEQEAEWHSMIATAYCLKGKTATGTQTREGVAASKREWFGKKARVYLNDNGKPGKLVGEYTIEDCGGDNILNGTVIDLWMEDEATCFAFGSRLVLVKIFD